MVFIGLMVKTSFWPTRFDPTVQPGPKWLTLTCSKTHARRPADILSCVQYKKTKHAYRFCVPEKRSSLLVCFSTWSLAASSAVTTGVSMIKSSWA